VNCLRTLVCEGATASNYFNPTIAYLFSFKKQISRVLAVVIVNITEILLGAGCCNNAVLIEFGREIVVCCEVSKPITEDLFAAVDAAANDMQDISHLFRPRCKVKITVN